LGPEKYGLLSYANTLSWLFMLVASLGLDSIVVRELVRSSDKQGAILGTSFILKLIAVLIMLFVVSFVGFLSEDSHVFLMVVIISSGFIFQPLLVIDLFYQSNVKSGVVVFVKSFQILSSAIIKLLLVCGTADLIWFAVVVVFDFMVLGLGILCVYLFQGGGFRGWAWDKTVAINLIRSGFPLLLSGVVVSIYMKIDQLMIGEMLGLASVGVYAVAVQLSEAWAFIPVVISISLRPVIVAAKESGSIKYSEIMSKLYGYMIWIALCISFVVTFFASEIIDILFGSEYKAAAAVLSVHVWSAVFLFLGVVSGNYLLAEKLHWRSFFRTLSGAIINIILNLILIPRFGLVGAAWSTVVAYFFAGYMYDLFDSKTRQVFFDKTVSAYKVIKWT